jgi:hypothetical protein
MPPKFNRQLLNSIIQGQTERNTLDQSKRTYLSKCKSDDKTSIFL